MSPIDFSVKRGERAISGEQLRRVEEVLGGHFIIIALPGELSGVKRVEVVGNVERKVISYAILSLAMEIFNDQRWVAVPHEPRGVKKVKTKTKYKTKANIKAKAKIK